MSVSEIIIPTMTLPTEDGEPLETNWHRVEINLLVESIQSYWAGRQDYFAGGNMFVYYSEEQALNRDYRGPDFFVVLNVDGTVDRGAWVVWQENGRYPDVIVELLSPSTAQTDRTTKKELYEQTFHTANYFLFDPDGAVLQGFRLSGEKYVELHPNEQGRLWCSTLGLWLGKWEGDYQRIHTVWLRFFDADGNLVQLAAEIERERAETAETRAEQIGREKAQAQIEAEQARTELEQLRARLRAAGIDPDALGAEPAQS
jgi:Uma2 family endonuclease